MNKKILAIGLLAGLAVFLVVGLKTAYAKRCCDDDTCQVGTRSYSCLDKPNPCPDPWTKKWGTCYYTSADPNDFCTQWGDWRACDTLGYTTRFCEAPLGARWMYQIALCDAEGNPIDEGSGGASCSPSDGVWLKKIRYESSL